MDVRIGLQRKLSTEELILLNCGAREDSWESLGLLGDKPVHPKGNQSWIVIGRTDTETEAPILWPPDARNWLTGKDPDAGNDWKQEEKGTAEDEMVGWHHRFNGHEFEQAPGDGDGQGSLVCCSPWGNRVGCVWVIEQQQHNQNWHEELLWLNNMTSVHLSANIRMQMQIMYVILLTIWSI